LERALESLPEGGPLKRDDIMTYILFNEYLVNLLEAAGLYWRGQSFSNRGWAVLLVVKAAKGDTPYVGFVTERTTTACMRVFLRKLGEGSVNWKPDKFA